jgi:hypothetical protein
LTKFYGKYASVDNRCWVVDGKLLAFTPAGLTSYTIPNGVQSIGYGAFEFCTSLKNITIPNSVTSIGDHAFYCCSSLESIAIPDSVRSIGVYAFALCSSLESVIIPEGIQSIGEATFEDCKSLRSVTIPDSVTEIGKYAFANCSSLTTVYSKPATPPTLGSDVFTYASLSDIYVPTSSVSAYKAAGGWSSYASIIEGRTF